MSSTTSDIENTLNSTKVDTCRERERVREEKLTNNWDTQKSRHTMLHQ
ncbi:hypothetical protein NC651_001742 [Populus alba x Populus x berolinensis]|nr:hypothetical protein NC651_001742 [Populus alba x Populus x berolinensis]